MFNGSVRVDGVEMPEAFLGSAPFVAAEYFGHRSRLYQMDLKRRPGNIANVMLGAYEAGVRGFQLILEDPVLEALVMAADAGCEFEIMGTLRPDHFQEDLEVLSELGASAALLDEHYTDLMPASDVSELLDEIDGMLRGLITTMPSGTTVRLLEEGVDNFELYMIPLNRLGYMMDFSMFLEDERRRLGELLGELGRTVVAEKVLAAGILSPVEAFDFLEGIDYVDMVTLGVASPAEALETFGELFGR